jgi:CRISPR-associated Cas5-like protein
MTNILLDPRRFQHREEVTVEMKALIAMWCRPSTRSNRVSYAIPTPTGLRGTLKSVYHSNGLFPVPRRVEFLSEPRTQSISQTMHRNTLLFGGPSVNPSKAPSSPLGAVYMYMVHYRVSYDVWAIEAKKVRTLRRRLVTGAFDNPPYLGTRECGTDITGVTETPVCTDVYLTEPRLFVGDTCGLVEAHAGVVVFPDWTIEALYRTRDQRVEASHATL